MEEGPLKVVKQATHPLPFLETLQVPILYVDGEPPYVPVFAVCRAIGIPPKPHIRRWRNLLLWDTARKLPFQTEQHGKRLVWCLSIAEIPFLYGMFNWKLVAPSMRDQIKRAAKEGARHAGIVYQEMQQRYAMTRQTLFSLLTECADIDERLDRQLERHLPSLHHEAQGIFAALVERGRSVHQKVADHARSMLNEQNALPIVDAVTLDTENKVIDTFSLPLLPLVPYEEREQLVGLLHQLASWHQEMAAFWRDWDKNRSPYPQA